MSPLLFKDAFWGSDFTCHVGYDALIQRLRDGRLMCKDVEDLLKMRAIAEEKYGKELVTIARKAGGHTEISTLRASFEQLKTQIESIGTFHIQLSDVLKEEVKHIETFRERQKEQRKKFQSIMEKVQKKKVTSYKKTIESKRSYELRCREADEAEQTAGTSKHPDKVRHRAKQSRQAAKEAEKLYFINTVQLEGIRKDWEETHASTCEVFQQLEGDRIKMLRSALWDHCNHFSMQCVKDDECHEQVRKQLEQCDVTTDNNCFIQTKGTGHRPTEPVAFESFYQTETSTDMNGQAHCTGEPDHVNMSFSDPLLSSSSVTISLDSLTNSQSTPTPSAEDSDGYAPLPAAPLTPDHTDEENSYVVNYDYAAQAVDELSVCRGDSVRVMERGEDGWWLVETDTHTGLVPGNYLSKI